MKHLFLPYELALLAKEKGFDEPCLGWYCHERLLPIGQNVTNESTDFRAFNNTHLIQPINGGGIAAPLYQQIIDWLREKHIRIVEQPAIFKDSWLVIIDVNYKSPPDYESPGFLSLDKAIEEAFKLIIKD